MVCGLEQWSLKWSWAVVYCLAAVSPTYHANLCNSWWETQLIYIYSETSWHALYKCWCEKYEMYKTIITMICRNIQSQHYILVIWLLLFMSVHCKAVTCVDICIFPNAGNCSFHFTPIGYLQTKIIWKSRTTSWSMLTKMSGELIQLSPMICSKLFLFSNNVKVSALENMQYCCASVVLVFNIN